MASADRENTDTGTPRRASGRSSSARGKAAGAATGAQSKTAGSRSRAKAAGSGARATSGSARTASSRTTDRARHTGPAETVGSYADRAGHISLGAALMARERMLGDIEEMISTYSSRSKAENQLRRFERRGSTARSELEQRIQSGLREGADRAGRRLKEGAELANRLQERLLSLL